MKIFFILLLFFLIIFISADININRVEGIKIESNTITLFKEGSYQISGIDFDKSIIVSCSYTLFLKDLTLISRNLLTPLIIDINYTVALIC